MKLLLYIFISSMLSWSAFADMNSAGTIGSGFDMNKHGGGAGGNPAGHPPGGGMHPPGGPGGGPIGHPPGGVVPPPVDGGGHGGGTVILPPHGGPGGGPGFPPPPHGGPNYPPIGGPVGHPPHGGPGGGHHPHPPGGPGFPPPPPWGGPGGGHHPHPPGGPGYPPPYPPGPGYPPPNPGYPPPAYPYGKVILTEMGQGILLGQLNLGLNASADTVDFPPCQYSANRYIQSLYVSSIANNGYLQRVDVTFDNNATVTVLQNQTVQQGQNSGWINFNGAYCVRRITAYGQNLSTFAGPVVQLHFVGLMY